ncbi:MAG: heme exporter protein CcmD [Brevundimonas sp.]|nr:MAG: heme exporter protein CcmD [Brevundimonas sp.]
MPMDLDMGRYGVFVWGSWGVTALGLAVIIVRSWLRARTWARQDVARAMSETTPS